ncbi:MAG: GWxTD domain-containing protein [Ignavibacteriae bacterium]|nr:GWxTD domain-containing protein [Ignavibacteriota bacterium]
MKIKVVGIVLILASLLIAQEKTNPIFLEHHSLLNDETQKEIISFRIPNNVLLFTKINEHYESKFSFSLEIFDSNLFILREIKTSTVSTSDYENTKKNSVFFQDMIEFSLSPGKYNLKTNLLVEGIDHQIEIPTIELIIDTLKNKKINSPIFVEKNKVNSNETLLLNFSNSIPLSSNDYEMIVRVSDTSVTELKYILTQFDKQIFKDSTTNYKKGRINFVKDENEISVSNDGKNLLQNVFVISEFSKLLNEGKAEIEISYKNEKEKFPVNVVWINKPNVLNNPEYSIRLLSYIDDEEAVKDLLFTSEEKYYEGLNEYWNSKYPTNGIKFNYAMNEYYIRADYAIEHYSSLNSFDGAENDRGRIYITYGKPTSIERNYSEKNEIMEIWNYEKLGRNFVFKDTSGTGKFILIQ